MDKLSKIYIAGHRGMVGSAIYRKLVKEGFGFDPNQSFVIPPDVADHYKKIDEQVIAEFVESVGVGALPVLVSVQVRVTVSPDCGDALVIARFSTCRSGAESSVVVLALLLSPVPPSFASKATSVMSVVTVNWNGFTASLQGKYTGRRYYTYTNDQSFGGYTTFDLGLGYHFDKVGPLKGAKVSLNVRTPRAAINW